MKEIEEIYGELRAAFEERTGLRAGEGCDLTARMYALAAQVYALYIQADWVVRQAFPQTAEGEHLDRHAQLRGLERKGAVAARGVVRFTAGEEAEEERVIPEGTVCMTAGLVRFETMEEGRLPGGALWTEVPVQALVPGTAGNVAAGAVVSMAVAPVGIAACSNPEAFAGGVDREEDASLRERVLDTFRRLPNGVNAAFYEREALSFERTAAAAVIPRPRGTGTVDVVVATREGVPDQTLLDELTAYFQTRREIAVEVRVRPPEITAVPVAVRVAAREGWDQDEVMTRVEDALRNWFTGERLGQSVLRAKLGNLIFACDGVENYAIDSPAADVAVAADELPQLDGLTVEAMV